MLKCTTDWIAAMGASAAPLSGKDYHRGRASAAHVETWPGRERSFFSGAPQPVHGQSRDRGRGLVRDRENRADIDFAQYVGVLARCRARAVEEVGIPDNRQRAGVDAE